MKKLLVLIVFLSLTFGQVILFAQQYIYKQFTTEDGLPSSEVYHVFQDSKGYIWFATDNGVSKYNGYEFENFDVNDGLPVNSISEIYEDYKGRIWFVGMNRTFSYFNNGNITKFKYNQKFSSMFKSGEVPLKSSFFVDCLETVFISIIGNGLFSIDNKGAIKNYDKFDNLTHGISIYHQFPKKVISSFKFQNIFLSKAKIYDDSIISDLTFEKVPEITPSHIFSTYKNEKCYFLSIGNYIYTIENNKITDIKNAKKYIQYLNLDKESNLWICYKNGGADCYINSKISESIKFHFLENENISSVLLDKNKGLWFTTLSSGVYYLPTRSIKCFDITNGLESNNLNCIAFDKNDIWISHNKPVATKLSEELVVTDKIHIKTPGNIKFVCPDTVKNEIYFGTENWIHKLYKDGSITTIKNNHSKIDIHNYGHTLFNVYNMSISNNMLWVSGGTGFYCIKNDNVIFDSRKDKNFLMRVNTICHDDSIIWLGTESGLWSYSNNILESYGDKNPLLKNRILDIVKKNDLLILATKGSGILLYDGKKVQKISKKDGLSSNTITNLLLKDSVLWSGSLNGLNKTQLKIGIDKIDIIKSTQIPELNKFEIRQLADKDNALYLATNKGLIKYTLHDNTRNINLTPTYITSFKVNDKEFAVQENYKLKNTENNIQINFEALFYKNPGSIHYRYKLIGLDNNWISTTSREAKYYYLSPGNYTFMVEAQNYNGEWSGNKTVITFRIIPTVWQTIYFKIGVGIFIISMLIMLYKVKMVSTRNKSLLRKNMYSYMMQALVGQMNPHFIFNTLNSINNYILTNDKRAASKYLVRFSKLIRRILDNSRLMYITLSEEIEALELYLEIENMRLKAKFDYSIECSENINASNLKVPSLLIQPFIENSIWHGIQPSPKHGLIMINISQNNDYLVIDIIDNGIGREKALKNNKNLKKSSLGSKITSNRFDLLSKTLGKKARIDYADLFVDNECMGTKVTLTLPLIIESTNKKFERTS